MPIVKSGVLKERKATRYDMVDGIGRKQHAEFSSIVQDENMVIDKNVIISSDTSTSLDVAFTLCEMHIDKENVEVAKK
ncbi:MAG TPA: hypothetical protein DCM62_04165 [Bacteroidales bacterium]|nr:hypothetical protein [Bacteroidales bacterium]